MHCGVEWRTRRAWRPARQGDLGDNWGRWHSDAATSDVSVTPSRQRSAKSVTWRAGHVRAPSPEPESAREARTRHPARAAGDIHTTIMRHAIVISSPRTRRQACLRSRPVFGWLSAGDAAPRSASSPDFQHPGAMCCGLSGRARRSPGPQGRRWRLRRRRAQVRWLSRAIPQCRAVSVDRAVSGCSAMDAGWAMPDRLARPGAFLHRSLQIPREI